MDNNNNVTIYKFNSKLIKVKCYIKLLHDCMNEESVSLPPFVWIIMRHLSLGSKLFKPNYIIKISLDVVGVLIFRVFKK